MRVEDIDRRCSELSRMDLFRGVSLDAVEHYFEEMTEITLEVGEVLLTPGQSNERLYLLAEGRLRIHLDAPDQPPLLVLEPGECVGEMSIIENDSVSAYVVSETVCRMWVVEQATVWGMIDASHGIARNLLHMLSQRVRFDNGVIVDGVVLQRQWEHYASVDALTGLHNRRWLDDVFERQVRRSGAGDQPLSVLMLDIDRFKDYNDCYGHLSGDQALRMLARELRQNLRPSDLAARFGGEEFMVLLPETAAEEAWEVAERLREAIGRSHVHTADGESLPGVTVSVGVASLGADQDVADLIAAVDSALYRAKAGGRNRVAM